MENWLPIHLMVTKDAGQRWEQTGQSAKANGILFVE